MSASIKIDFVSDVVCPWCAIGLHSLLKAIEAIGGGLQVELHFQPFELNPDLPADGESIAEHLGRKYGLGGEQLDRNTAAIVQRAAGLGFTIDPRRRTHLYNTFDAHRLLHWAGTLGGDAQLRLKLALLRAYHGEGRNLADPAELLRIVAEAGLDVAAAEPVLQAGTHAPAVREREAYYRECGINGVPAVILNDRHLIQGGQPPEVFEQALRALSGLA